MAENNEVTRVAFAEPIEVNVNIPNIEGRAGRDGRDGDDAYRVAVRNGFLGTEQEWLASLGGGGQIKETLNEFKKHNVWLDSTSLDNVLLKIVTLSQCLNNATYADLRYDTYRQGQLFIDFYGEPHFYIRINDGEKREFVEPKLRVSLDGSMGNKLLVKYYGINDEVLQTESISLITEETGAGQLGALLKTYTIEQARNELYVLQIPSTAQGSIEKHSNGAKITLTNYPTSPYTINVMYKNLFKALRQNENYEDDANIDTFVIDVTSCPQIASGTFPSTTQTSVWSDMWQYADTIVVKLKPENLPNQATNKSVVEFVGVQGKRIKFNNSEMITCEDSVLYEYRFDLDRIEKANHL